jgi:hypothetical protein
MSKIIYKIVIYILLLIMNNCPKCICNNGEIKTEREKEYKIIIKRMSAYILEITESLTMYKEFHDKILENGAIQDKFDDYNNTITELEIENKELRKELKKIELK